MSTEKEIIGQRILDLGGADPWADFESCIDGFFPMPSYRDGQKEAIITILKAFRDGYKYVVAECPTGSGKSAIAYTVSRFFDYTYWLTIQKVLQDQLVRDFGSSGNFTDLAHVLVDLKGRNAYPCDYWERYLRENKDKMKESARIEYSTKAAQSVGCDAGYCKRNGQAKDSFCFPEVESDVFSYCAYWQRKEEAIRSKICALNFSSFLFQTRATNDFGTRNLMIIDESHNVESELLKFIELKISDKNFRVRGIRFPNKDTAEEYADFFQSIELEELIKDRIVAATMEQDLKEEAEWKYTLLKYATFIKSAQTGNWISEFKERKTISGEVLYNTITIKPLFVDQFAQDYIFSKSVHALMMSATILSKGILCQGLGINEDEVFAYRMRNRFPVKNRRIFHDSCGSLSYKNKYSNFPKLIKKVNEICSKHAEEKGIIHTHTFEIANLLIKECKPAISKRFLFQRDFDTKNDMLKHHARSSKTILVAPAMHEGIDLVDDLSRFQIICKIPYPSLSDPQVRARMDITPQFYDWITAQKLIQSYGRSVRSAEDWAVTYVMDDDFRMFCKRASNMLPSWFKEAIVK